MLPNYNSFPHQMQPQLGIKNNQIPIPFSNSNTHLSNGHGGGGGGVAMPNMPPSMIPQPNFMNLPNNLLPTQNNHLGMPQFGSVGPASQPGQPHAGFFGSQNSAHGLNSLAPFPLQGQQFCNLVQNLNQVLSSQQPGQLFGQNMFNLPQQMIQNMGFPYGQFCLPNQLQNRNQFVPMQMQNSSQGGPNYAFAGSSQAPQGTISQNVPFSANHQFSNLQTNQAAQQVNQNQQNLAPPPSQGTQGNHTNTRGVNNKNSNWKHSPSKNFAKHLKRGVQPQGGFQNSQFHHTKNAKEKFGFPNGHKGRGLRNESERKFTNQGLERKRSLFLSYTEQEIQRWREERRKHFPSKSIIEKKLSEKLINSEVIEREARTRREQLKEILTKQAELGVEVAEIPSYYLTDSNQGHGGEENGSLIKNGPMSKKGRFPNKFGKRERYDRKDRFAKRQRPHPNDNDSSSDLRLSKREPTLLQKLLSVEIRRDRNRLLQAFRFMVANSFFKDCPDKPLEFPAVAVTESGCKEDGADQLSSLAEKDASEGIDKSMVERVLYNHCEDNNDVGDEDDDEEGIDEEEEGEIIN